MDLAGSVNTPVGHVSKKTALYAGGGAAVILGYAYWRYTQTKKAEAVAASGASVGIDPATGFLYGSPEDAAALANQATYVTPTSVGGTGGGGGGSGGGGGFTSNAQWVQAAIQYLETQGLIQDPTTIAGALGRYVTGSPVTPEDVNLIQQAIAVEGMPPVAGPNGYPPSLNTIPVVVPPAGALPAPGGFRDEGPQWTTHIVYRWESVPGAVKYRLRVGYTNETIGDVTGTGWQRDGLVHNGTYFTQIAAIDANGNVGAWSPILTSHTKN